MRTQSGSVEEHEGAPLQILHVNSYMLAGNFYRHMYSRQARNGHRVTAYVPAHRSIDAASFDVGFPADIAPVFGTLQRLSYFAKQRSILSDALERYSDNSFQIIHAHSLFANGNVAMELGRTWGIPYVVAVRGTDVNIFFARAMHLRRKGVEILRNAAHVVFISEPSRRKVAEKYVPVSFRSDLLQKSSVLPNGIEDFWLEDQHPHLDVPTGRPLRLLQVGDIWGVKDPLTTAKAAAILSSRGIETSVRFIGKPREPKLAAELSKLPGVTLVPFQGRENLRDEYRQSDVMVMPSVQETFGLVYAEAMSQGLPVVYTRDQGFDGQFPEGDVGFRVEPRTPEAVADAVTRIVDDFPRMSATAQNRAKRFRWSRIVSEYDEIYVDAIGSAR